MPYRPGIIIQGEDLADETVAINRAMRKRLKPVPVLQKYEDETELFDHATQLSRETTRDKKHRSEVRDYINFWAGVKYRESMACSDRGEFDPCPKCGTCRCGNGRFKCLCAEGKRMLSPYRIVWMNNAKREFWQKNIWQVGVGYVPKQKFEGASPTTKDLDW